MKKLFLYALGPVLVAACSKGGGGGQSSGGSQALLGVSDTVQARQAQPSKYRFYVDLNTAPGQTVTVNYATVPGTAKENTDYTPASGTLTFSAGQKEAFVDIQVTGDSLRRDDQQFYLQLSNPVNAKLGKDKGTATIQNSNLLFLPTDTTGYSTPSSYAGYHLAWSDEFNGTALNTQDWNYEQGGSGWGNHELENYTNRTQNAFVSAGHLVIEARQESFGGNSYTSARLTTQNKQTFTYGRIDIRAKLPVLKGMWPALWMLGTNISTINWPGCGETDIMELVGSNPRQILGSLHWQQSGGSEGNYSGSYNLTGQDFSQQFHVFSVLWKKDTVQFLVDDHQYGSDVAQQIVNGSYPFNSPFFFLFNVAVGGDWPGPPDNTTVFPQRMFIDSVRVFQP